MMDNRVQEAIKLLREAIEVDGVGPLIVKRQFISDLNDDVG